jgi:adenylate cyclase class IV
MKNIELKVGVDDFSAVSNGLDILHAVPKGRLIQLDTYFNFPSSRLKLREIDRHIFELIWYRRPNAQHSKISRYHIFKLRKPFALFVKTILSFILGRKVTVEKSRALWMYKKTRIHLDVVKDLGNFVELETVTNSPEKDKAEHNKIVRLLGLASYQSIAVSYSDILLDARKGFASYNTYQHGVRTIRR